MEPSDKYSELRRKAEEMLKLKERQSDITELSEESADKVLHMIHQFHVYQAELEIQNEELRKSQHELELSREKYRNLYDFAPVGYFTL